MSQGSPELLKMLAEIDPLKPYGTTLFNALIRLGVTPGIEAVCLRLNDEKAVQVYLTQRSMDETAYPGEWHCPGTVRRPHETIEMGFRRLEAKEFGGQLSSWRYVADVDHPTEARAHLVSQVYLCVLKEDPGLRGKWFPVFPLDGMPEATIETHRKRIIPCAVGAFLAANLEVSI